MNSFFILDAFCFGVSGTIGSVFGFVDSEELELGVVDIGVVVIDELLLGGVWGLGKFGLGLGNKKQELTAKGLVSASIVVGISIFFIFIFCLSFNYC
ncbi:hypothetical protein [Mycoplasma crocodyli]|uniref:hypothetical protein n=1 Tax=Mycoplasma crocodyli TaxID=50052 RepID=UPI0011D0BE66|nr:hypothetical protein [Mycoplasma crocodyli]